MDSSSRLGTEFSFRPVRPDPTDSGELASQSTISSASGVTPSHDQRAVSPLPQSSPGRMPDADSERMEGVDTYEERLIATRSCGVLEGSSSDAAAIFEDLKSRAESVKTYKFRADFDTFLLDALSREGPAKLTRNTVPELSGLERNPQLKYRNSALVMCVDSLYDFANNSQVDEESRRLMCQILVDEFNRLDAQGNEQTVYLMTELIKLAEFLSYSSIEEKVSNLGSLVSLVQSKGLDLEKLKNVCKFDLCVLAAILSDSIRMHDGASVQPCSTEFPELLNIFRAHFSAAGGESPDATHILDLLRSIKGIPVSYGLRALHVGGGGQDSGLPVLRAFPLLDNDINQAKCLLMLAANGEGGNKENYRMVASDLWDYHCSSILTPPDGAGNNP